MTLILFREVKKLFGKIVCPWKVIKVDCTSFLFFIFIFDCMINQYMQWSQKQILVYGTLYIVVFLMYCACSILSN